MEQQLSEKWCQKKKREAKKYSNANEPYESAKKNSH